MAADLWNVVLAAGHGRRLTPVTQGTPKQYWRPGSGRSLLEETFARVGPLAPPARTTVVVDRTHRRYVKETARPWPSDWIVYQPADRGTAAGVLLALSPVLDASADAIVVMTPSDHGVEDSAGYRAGVRDAVAAVRSDDVDVVLFGVEPSAPVTDYGWIVPGPRYGWAGNRPLRAVRAFAEKPAFDAARRLFAARALWNTMVVVARARALQALCEMHVPHWARVFDAHQRLHNQRRASYLAEQYAVLPPADFSHDVLTHARGLAVYSWGPSIGWSDLGTPDRLFRWLNGAQAELSA